MKLAIGCLLVLVGLIWAVRQLRGYRSRPREALIEDAVDSTFGFIPNLGAIVLCLLIGASLIYDHLLPE